MNKFFRGFKKEYGAVEVVEAAFVFPIVIFVVILLIYLGNLFYQQAKVDAIATRGAELLVAYYTNPMLTKDSIPKKSTEINVKPYRYLLGDADAEGKVKKYIQDQLKKTGDGLIAGMKLDAKVNTCEVKNYVLYQTAAVEIQYSIQLAPMQFFGDSGLYRLSTATVTAAADPDEFIRNVDMVMDYSESSGLTQKIKDLVGTFMG